MRIIDGRRHLEPHQLPVAGAQAMDEQRSGSAMISSAAERMIDMIHEIFQVATNQAGESEKIVGVMQQVRAIADGNRVSASEMMDALALLQNAIRAVGESRRG